MNIIEQLDVDDIRAFVMKHRLGGEAVVIIESPLSIDQDEVMLVEAQARALHEWLGRVLAASTQETPAAPQPYVWICICGKENPSEIFRCSGCDRRRRPNCPTANR